ncbi:MAG TPA: hypothetical protein ACQGQX_07065, partial [Xylella taiwanensis]
MNELASSTSLVRAAKRIADAFHAPWTAVYIETTHTRQLGSDEHQHIADVFALATQLGGQVATVPAAHVVDGLEAFA